MDEQSKTTKLDALKKWIDKQKQFLKEMHDSYFDHIDPEDEETEQERFVRLMDDPSAWRG